MLKLEISKQAVADTVILIPNARDVVICAISSLQPNPEVLGASRFVCTSKGLMKQSKFIWIWTEVTLRLPYV
jgi:hypothetical protein